MTYLNVQRTLDTCEIKLQLGNLASFEMQGNTSRLTMLLICYSFSVTYIQVATSRRNAKILWQKEWIQKQKEGGCGD